MKKQAKQGLTHKQWERLRIWIRDYWSQLKELSPGEIADRAMRGSRDGSTAKAGNMRWAAQEYIEEAIRMNQKLSPDKP